MKVEKKQNSLVGLVIGLGVAGMVLILMVYILATGGELKLIENHVECTKGLTGFWGCRGQYDSLSEATQAKIGGGLNGPTELSYWVDLTVQVGGGMVTVSFTDKYGHTTTQQIVAGQSARFEGYVDFFPELGGSSRAATFLINPEGGIATNVQYTVALR